MKVKVLRKKRKTGPFDIFLVVFFVIYSLIMIFPFYNAFIISIVPESHYINNPLSLYPASITLESYREVVEAKLIWNAYGITVLEVIVGTFCNVFVTIAAGYVLSRKKFFLRNFFMNLILFTMFFGGGFIPWYRLLISMGFKNNLLVLVIPGLVDTYNLLLARNYFASLPDEFEESAKIDGANEIVILSKIFIPIALPIIATITLFYAVGHWNSWYTAMLFLNRAELQPLPLMLRRIVIDNTGAIGASPIDRPIFSDGIKMASIFFTMAPIMMVYPFLQKYFVKGILIGALKG
jgi:putative aldouronate transport system permease protein